MRKRTVIRLVTALSAFFLLLVLFYMCLPTVDWVVYGPTRLFEFKIRNTDGRILKPSPPSKIPMPNTAVEIEWEKGGGKKGSSQQEVEYRADGSFHVKWTTVGFSGRPVEPVAVIFTISRARYKQSERVFSMQELDQEWYVRTENDMRVYRLPDFVLEGDGV